MAKTMTATAGKREARSGLRGIHGVDSIGIAWDSQGHPVVRVDLSPEADRAAVERCLSAAEVPYLLRTVKGTVTAL
ncbi:hypothetical protein [Methylobacterium isbiliense]|uniref:Uncharacterized protein n=1 Tax=Methylobacterium isbiliense TaxID=315478 RepID=A0ABQ4SE32_9HYPH|nr:hypothetical protein [Methylobacterium isbiliense]MDN3624376.1 hypothetical protein [Methylobacterium isbiliense]GJE01349.1 hypothetical protein GMJLKIPL_3279 [Methylobacterium isbiliense]